MILYIFWGVGAYIGIALLVGYVLFRTEFFGEDDDVTDVAAFAIFWVLTVPFAILFGGIPWLFTKMFEMIKEDTINERKNKGEKE